MNGYPMVIERPHGGASTVTARRGGRPTRYTDARADAALAALRLGATYRLAAAAAGVSVDTFDRWRSGNARFAEKVRAVETEAIRDALTCINAAATAGNWHAAAWLLARRYPDDYGRSVTRHEGQDGGPVQMTVRVVYEDVPVPGQG